MKRYKRRLFFYTLVLVFILAAPVLVAYSFGYRFNFVEGALEKTGGIFVKSKTPRLSIFLNGAFIKETSFISGGAILPEISPGSYLLRIEKIGFHPWSKTVRVEPSLVTELRNILLVPNPPEAATSTRAEILLLTPFRPPTPAFKLDKKNNLVEIANTQKTLASNLHSFGVIDGVVYFADQNGFLAKLFPENGAIDTVGRPGFFLGKNPLRFIKSPKGDIFILDSAEGLFVHVPGSGEITTITSGVKEIYFDGRGAKALLLKNYAVEMLWLEDNSYQPFQKRKTLEKIITLKVPVEDARWFYGDNTHIAIKTADGIYFTEVDGRGGRNTVELVSGRTDELATAPEIPNAVFYKKGKTWFKIEI